MTSDTFAPSRAAAIARLAAVRPADYARSRNALDGAVTRLSPYLTHGVLTLPEVHAAVAARFALDPRHKLVYEFGWREYFHHVWQHLGEAVFSSLHPGPLPDTAYAGSLPEDIRQGRTGVPAIDCAVAALYATGYLHNHARMWLASYVVHLRKVHWRAGADWLYGHLLDGDLASNHLSWQWVAGTGSHKPYLFNAANVAKYAPPAWHSPGTAIDTEYETLERIACCPSVVVAEGPVAESGPDEPVLAGAPPAAAGYDVPDPAAVRGRTVWLLHPWALRAPPPGLPDDAVVVAVAATDWHARWPWSPARWHFVAALQQTLAPLRWAAPAAVLAEALASAREVQVLDDPHLRQALVPLTSRMIRHPAPRLFASVSSPCASFSQWWRRTRLAG